MFVSEVEIVVVKVVACFVERGERERESHELYAWSGVHSRDNG